MDDLAGLQKWGFLNIYVNNDIYVYYKQMYVQGNGRISIFHRLLFFCLFYNLLYISEGLVSHLD